MVSRSGDETEISADYYLFVHIRSYGGPFKRAPIIWLMFAFKSRSQWIDIYMCIRREIGLLYFIRGPHRDAAQNKMTKKKKTTRKNYAENQNALHFEKATFLFFFLHLFLLLVLFDILLLPLFTYVDIRTFFGMLLSVELSKNACSVVYVCVYVLRPSWAAIDRLECLDLLRLAFTFAHTNARERAHFQSLSTSVQSKYVAVLVAATAVDRRRRHSAPNCPALIPMCNKHLNQKKKETTKRNKNENVLKIKISTLGTRVSEREPWRQKNWKQSGWRFGRCAGRGRKRKQRAQVKKKTKL